jgi:hypothetical protein
MIELHVSSKDLSINHQVKEGKVCANPPASTSPSSSKKGEAHQLKGRNFDGKIGKSSRRNGKIKGCAINHTSLNSPLGLIYMCLGKV